MRNIGEFDFIDKISRGCLIRPDRVVTPIGDDAAAYRNEAGNLTLVTTDLLVERVHFIRAATSGFNLGHKALAVNLSDIAAMGGIAREAFVSIAIPDDCSLDYLQDLYRGMQHLAAEFKVNILGGDTTGSKTDLVINVTVTGSVAQSDMLLRSTAQVGDIIFSTGCLGDSRAGLHLILNRITADSKEMAALVDTHLLPRPYLEEGRFLAGSSKVHAAIDVSDGLSSDLGHVVRASRVGARLYARQIPISPHLQRFCSRFHFDPIDFALAGGEDYTLLCTSAREAADNLAKDYRKRFDRRLHPLGEISDSNEIELVEDDGRVRVIAPSGWDHFKSE